MKIKLTLTAILILNLFISNAQTVYLYTPNGSKVSAFQIEEMSTGDINAYTEYYRSRYPQATVLANASASYNCHSYAWNMLHGGPTCWLNQSPDLHLYWDDKSYSQVSTSNAGDKVFYYSGDHSAVVSTVAGMYESKWGSMPLMRHSPTYGPTGYNMQYRRYYRRACISDYSNKTVSANTTVNGCDNLTAANVTVTNGATLTITASQRITINNRFIANSGTKLVIGG